MAIQRDQPEATIITIAAMKRAIMIQEVVQGVQVVEGVVVMAAIITTMFMLAILHEAVPHRIVRDFRVIIDIEVFCQTGQHFTTIQMI